MRQALTNDEFLEELTTLVRREGIKNLTVGDIAARLHCSRRRLYDIAKTKQELFCVVVERLFRSQLDEGDALVRKERDPVKSLVAYLDVGVRGSYLLSKQFLADVEQSDQARACFDSYQQARAAGLSELIDQGVRAGLFNPCHGPLVAEVMLKASQRLRQPAFLAQAGVTLEEAFREFYRVILGGLLIKGDGLTIFPSSGEPSSDEEKRPLVDCPESE